MTMNEEQDKKIFTKSVEVCKIIDGCSLDEISVILGAAYLQLLQATEIDEDLAGDFRKALTHAFDLAEEEVYGAEEENPNF